MASSIKQAGPEKMSKKQFSETVLARLTGSLADFNLKEKKLETRLKKVSRRLAADILKTQKALAKEKAKETNHQTNGVAVNKKNKEVETVKG